MHLSPPLPLTRLPLRPPLPVACSAAAENPAYHQLMLHWMANRYTLRYSGGMVPDVHHMLAKVCGCGWSVSSFLFVGFEELRSVCLGA